MHGKLTSGLIAATAVMAFAFTAPNASKQKTYNVDTKSTTVTWIGRKVTGEHTGKLSLSKGSVVTDGANIKSGTFQFDMTSITNTDLTDKAYNDKLVGHLKSPDFFSVEKYPTASFELTKATLKSGNDYDLTGNLTIKGITNEVTFPAMIKMDGKTFVAVAKIMVDRTKYDIKYGSASFFEGIGDKAISNEFEMNVNVVANAE
ncbi:MAG: YceI family protein [Bacteroidia bacterium]